MSDFSSAVKCLIQYVEGKHPDDAPLKKFISDVTDEFQKVKEAVEGFANAYGKDAQTLTDDGLATVADIAQLAASPFALSQVGNDVKVLIELIKQISKDVADAKQAVADFKAGSSGSNPTV